MQENEGVQFTRGDNQQLLYEAEHDVKNYTDRGYCYPSAKVDKSLQVLDNSSHFRMIVYYLSSGMDFNFFKTLAFFSARFQDVPKLTPLKWILFIERYVLRILVFLPFSFTQKLSYFVL